VPDLAVMGRPLLRKPPIVDISMSTFTNVDDRRSDPPSPICSTVPPMAETYTAPLECREPIEGLPFGAAHWNIGTGSLSNLMIVMAG